MKRIRQLAAQLAKPALAAALAAAAALASPMAARAEDEPGDGHEYEAGQQAPEGSVQDLLALMEAMGSSIEALELQLEESLRALDGPPYGPGSFTPDGAGTIVDNLLSPTGMEFLSVSSVDGGVFYVVIDRNRPDGNVYLLRAVASADLQPLSHDYADFIGDAEPDLTNEELLHILAEIIASGIYVHLQDGGAGAVAMPEAPGQPVFVYGEPEDDGPGLFGRAIGFFAGLSVLQLVMLALAVFGAGVLGAQKLGLPARFRRGKDKPHPEWGDDAYEEHEDGQEDAQEGGEGAPVERSDDGADDVFVRDEQGPPKKPAE